MKQSVDRILQGMADETDWSTLTDALAAKLEQFAGIPLIFDEPMIDRPSSGFCRGFKGRESQQTGRFHLHLEGTFGMQMVAVADGNDAERLHIAAFLLFSLDEKPVKVLDDRRYLELEFSLEEEVWKDCGWQVDEYGEFS